MAKGVSMPIARRVSDGRTVRANAVGEDDNGPFRCHQCGTLVDHVNGYPIRKDDPDLARYVKAFFRLTKGHEHNAGCVYVPGAQLEQIVRRADEAVEDSVNPFAKDPNRDQWVFRLNIPTEEKEEDVKADPKLERAPNRERIERVWTGKRIESYCRSAVGLAKLWRALEASDGREELRAKVRIVVMGRIVPWEEFFFSEDAMGEFADRVEAKRLGYPVALLLYVDKIETTAFGLQVIFMRMKDEAALDDVRIAVEAFGKRDVLNDFVSGNHYIVFGDFSYRSSKPWKPPGRERPITFRDIRIRVFRKSQYELIEGFEPIST